MAKKAVAPAAAQPSAGQVAKSGFGLVKGLIFAVIAIVILIFVFSIADNLPKVAVDKVQTTIDIDAWYWKAPGFLLGITGSTTLEAFIIQLMVFLIIFVAISDILSMFSTFSSNVSWIIGFALAAIAGVSGIVNTIVGILGITAGIGALGISVIIIGSLVAAVTLNLGLGGWARKWRMQRQLEVDAIKSTKGANSAASAIAGLKEVNRAFKAGELD
ncbi:hypothetical protein FJZ17_02285 [Candidatus Pacearchaeota archaeon]|nr:hypothetical protein [Candidatus Pacearchaeota archaeon]